MWEVFLNENWSIFIPYPSYDILFAEPIDWTTLGEEVMAQDVHEVHNMTGTDRLNEASITPTTSDIAPGTLEPSVSYSTHLALTVTCVVIFSLMFLFVYIQLWMVLYYKHKRRSYQTIFLFLCLVWAALRVTLFSFYFSKSDVMLANNLYPAVYWLLYSCPVVLQFTTLVLLVSFFSQVRIYAHTDKRTPNGLLSHTCASIMRVFLPNTATLKLVRLLMMHI